MLKLSTISEKCQQIAETISAVLGVETEIVDSEFAIVAGTGKYRDMINTKDYEAKYYNSPYLYARVLQTGQTFIIEDAASSELYGPRDMGELCEICCAIRLKEEIIGVLALVAFDSAQQARLLSNRENLRVFLQNMASMLASHLAELETYNRLAVESRRLEVLVESITRGIIAVDRNLNITHCNQEAEKLTGFHRSDLIGRPISEIWPQSPIEDVVKNNKFYRDKEEYYINGRTRMRLLVSLTPINVEDRVMGAVAFFQDLDEARKTAYAITNAEIETEFDQIKGASSKILGLKNQALRIAQGNSTVLIMGESGTGKELFARAIHYASPRKDKPLVQVNCGAIPDTLLESELFGYVEGAFTGARRGGRPGKFEVANGGTIFLDEIGDLPLHLQVKLLHVLQRKQLERIGGNKVIPLDVRVIAATNRNLEEMCERGEFREDLYYRLSVIPLPLVPLRERPEDIEILIEHFLLKYCRLMAKSIRGLSDDVRKALLAFPWPGNVRELENAIEYAVNMEASPYICLDSIPAKVRSFWRNKDHVRRIRLEEQLKDCERQLLTGFLNQVREGRLKLTELAGVLGISRATLYRKIKEHNLSEPRQ